MADKQPLNEAYHNEVLEAYAKISDTFDSFTQLMRSRVPVEEWPKDLQGIAGVSEELLGKSNQQVLTVSHCPPPEPKQMDLSLPCAMISRIEDLGRAQHKLKMILDIDILNNLSKHDPYWNSDHEFECNKLHQIRIKLSCLSDELWDLWTILRKEES